MTDQPAADAEPATRSERELPQAVADLTEWLSAGVNSVQRARDAQRVIDAIEEVRDENLREAWSHRKPSADVKDLATLTGVLVPTIVRALYWPNPPKPE